MARLTAKAPISTSSRCSRRSSASRSTIPTGCSRRNGTASVSRPASPTEMWVSGRGVARTRRHTSGPSCRRRTWLDAHEAVVDGEVIALDDHGEPDFGLLQQRIGRRGGGTGGGVVYEAFDLMYIDGASLIDLPLEDRKARLRAVLRDDPRVRLSDHVVGAGRASFEAARERRLEGIVAKQRQSPYLPGRRATTWLKIKTGPAGVGGRRLDDRYRLCDRSCGPVGGRQRRRRAAVCRQGRGGLQPRFTWRAR